MRRPISAVALKNYAGPRFRALGSIELRSYAPTNPTPVPPSTLLQSPFVAPTKTASREFRQRFGRSISLDRIESALQSAYRGSMRSITDLSRETVDTDPHLASVLNKRFRALSSLPWTVVPAAGFGVDKEKALFYASVVREQLNNLAAFRHTMMQLAWGLFDGRAAQEIVWTELPLSSRMVDQKYGTTSVAIRSLAWIHPRRLSFDTTRALRVTDETFDNVGGNFSNVGLPLDSIPFKFVQWTPQLFGEYPEREGLAQRCLYWSFFKRFSARDRMILLELFGKPWRIIKVDEESTASREDLVQADENVDNLGGSFTTRMPRGTDLTVVQPGRTAGAVHQDVIEESDKQISKLVLGQTGTTDGVPAGLNSNQANVMQDEQLMILQADAGMLSELIEDQITDAIISLNFGPEEVTHAPQFRLRSDLPADRKAELERLQSALNAGLAIKREEAYEISGFSVPDENDIVIRIDQPPTPPLAPVAPAPRAVIVYPKGTSPESGEQNPPASQAGKDEGGPDTEGSGAQVGVGDLSATITVNEDRASRGLPPLELPDGSPDPDGDLTVAEFKTKRIEAKPTGAPAQADGGDSEEETPETGTEMHVHSLPDGGFTLEATTGEPHTHELPDGGETGPVIEREGGHVHELPDGGETGPEQELEPPEPHGGGDGGDGGDGGGDSSGAGEAAAAASKGYGYGGQKKDSKKKSGASTNTATILLTIRQTSDGRYEVLSSDGTRSFGIYDSKAEAQQRLDQIEFFKTMTRTSSSVATALASFDLGNEGVDEFDAVMSNIVETEHQLDLMSRACSACGNVELIANQQQPETQLGSVETLLGKAASEARSPMRAIADRFKASIDGVTSVTAILTRLREARQAVDVAALADALEPKMVQAIALGALDAEVDTGGREGGASVERIARASRAKKVRLSDFSSMSFEAAIEFFKKKNPVQREVFERLSTIARQRSFTVAGIISDQALATIQVELARQIEAGNDLRGFAAFIEERLKSAGFLATVKDLRDGTRALSASHVETVFRTNMLSAYNTGRHAHMTDPVVLSRRPVWEIRAVKDGATRRAHRRADGAKLLATDPFWDRAYPPFGFNCRCRVISRGRDELDNVVDGSTITGLPDPGFSSGTSGLLR